MAYLEKRTAQMGYPRFQAEGWPIASGATESGNKLVVEARLKGAGMHWARAQVDPMLALRNVACNDRWAEAWPQMASQLRRQARQQRTTRRQQRRARAQAETTRRAPPPPRPVAPPAAVRKPPPAATAEPVPRRPAANLPWRRNPACVPSRSRWSPH